MHFPWFQQLWLLRSWCWSTEELPGEGDGEGLPVNGPNAITRAYAVSPGSNSKILQLIAVRLSNMFTYIYGNLKQKWVLFCLLHAIFPLSLHFSGVFFFSFPSIDQYIDPSSPPLPSIYTFNSFNISLDTPQWYKRLTPFIPIFSSRFFSIHTSNNHTHLLVSIPTHLSFTEQH